jgi:hypothetical protein
MTTMRGAFDFKAGGPALDEGFSGLALTQV